MRSLPKLALTLVGALSIITPACAGKPEIVLADLTWVEETCGFPLEVHLEGRVISGQMPNGENRLVSSEWQHTYTNPATGKSVVMKSAGVQFWSAELNEDGNLVVHSVGGGTEWRVIAPGSATGITAGRASATYIIDNETGEVLEFTIEPLSNARRDDVEVLICELLAP